MKPLIYAVEDDPAISELYSLSLENEFECRCFDDGASLFITLDECTPDLILLDIMLPGDDGFTILTRLKNTETTAKIPVIMVSAKGEELSKVKGLNMGADDYIAKPFGVLELIARIKANLRKNIPSPTVTAYKDIFIDSAKHEISVNGSIIKTTLKEYNLLCLLCDNAGVCMQRDAIFNKVWGASFIGETRTLDIHIKQLRRRLSDAQSTAEIKTVRGVGYMLI